MPLVILVISAVWLAKHLTYGLTNTEELDAGTCQAVNIAHHNNVAKYDCFIALYFLCYHS